PEHTVPGSRFDRRSDIFSLGTILYELLTGSPPFHGETFGEQVRRIRQQDPTLPRRRNPEIPGDFQDVCLKALEKKPENRYASAREMADDLERFLAGEKVHAVPTAYSNLMSGMIEQHLRELEGWREEEIVSEHEYEALRKDYGRLVEREDAWILNARRLSLPQVSLYLGANSLAATTEFVSRCLDPHGGSCVVVPVPVCGSFGNARGHRGGWSRGIDGGPRTAALEIGTVAGWNRLPAGVLPVASDCVARGVWGVSAIHEGCGEPGLGVAGAYLKDVQTNYECADLVGGDSVAASVRVAEAVYEFVGVFARFRGNDGVVMGG